MGLTIARVIHLFGVMLWIGGGAAGAWIVAGSAQLEPAQRRAVLAQVRGALLFVSAPGLVLAWLGGLAMFAANLEVFRSAGWLHAKITVALVASALSGVLSAKVRRAVSAEGTASVGGVGLGLVVSALVVTLLAVLRPF